MTAPQRERLDRLHATEERTRQDPGDAVAGQHLDQPLGLPRAARIEWPQPIVAFPALSLAGARVANEEQPLALVESERRYDCRFVPIRQDRRRGSRPEPANLVDLLAGAEVAGERTHREVADALAA